MAYPSTYTADTVNQLAAALNAQRASSGAKWEGGLGADKSALYMADELAKSGITDLSQVGQGDGNIINKVTGQPLYSGYGERTGGNIWSGSYEGGGNTGFGVNFDAQGNPVFFTQGASSSTLKDDLVKAAALAAAAYGGYQLMGGEALFGGAGLTTSELASADMALGGAGGTAGAEALAGTAAASSGLSASQIANLAKAGINVAGLVGTTTALSNQNSSTPTNMAIPTQSTPQYTQDYYTQLQNTYNQIMPGVPRDVVSNLASWYGSGGGLPATQDTGITSGLFSKELAATKPTVTTPTTPVGSDAYNWATKQGGMTDQQYLNNINQWIIDNPNASLADINAIKSKLGVSDVDVQTALGQSNFSDATKYALTHGMGLSDVNQNIVDWLAKNPAATNAQIQAEQAKYSVSDADVARALTEQNASAAKEYAIINDMGLDQYYKNIANAAQSGLSPAEAAAQMKQYGVSPTDVQTAYSMFAPKAGLTLDEVLAAYNTK
jgi:hypothetical protein